ncbi:HAMP domain-containing histidine kinase [Paenibacillus albidus]|uniref:sensor histidine kinase n=1 Tax=Paenibacillus albidus TaxID=2041023 RepID=UPI001BE9113A|nr:HAMP domain-containing sensor histidine kinase [Paenibacillus albidus]MBT2289405.1 HAMP domain-containing histidine kinase [Paenibacillus albidus]
MNTTKQILLLSLQLLLTAILALFYAESNSSPLLWWCLLGSLAGVTGLLILSAHHSRSQLQKLAAELRRAVNGNMKMRLLANEDHSWNEVLFTINELMDVLEQVQVEAARSQAARKTLLSSISHDIRTPLTSIIGYVDAIKDNIAGSDQEKQQYLDILSVKSKGLKVLIEDLFTMAKLDADELPLSPEAVDLAEIARETLIGFLPELDSQAMKLQLLIPEAPCMIMADRASLARIINNIIKNALLYGHEGGVLGVGLEDKHQDWELLIWDRGPGISQPELIHIFQRSYRGDQGRQAGHGGSGLGLAIAKALVQKNGGRIRVDSIPWEKTEFGLSFPKYDASRKLRNS